MGSRCQSEDKLDEKIIIVLLSEVVRVSKSTSSLLFPGERWVVLVTSLMTITARFHCFVIDDAFQSETGCIPSSLPIPITVRES